MKIFAVLLVVTFSSIPGYAGDNGAKYVDPDTKIEELVSSVERWRWLPWKLNTALMHLGDEISQGGVSDKALRDMTRRLVKIYYSLSDIMMSSANKKRIIELVGTDNGPEAHEFFLQVLSDANTEYRDRALRTIYPKGIHGDDLYEKIKNLENANAFPKAKSLMYLKLANPERALKEIHEFLRTTQNPDEFVRVSLNVSTFYRDPGALDVVFDRYLDLKKRPGAESVSSAIAWSSLREYLEGSEGEKFAKAMEVFVDQGIFEPAARTIVYKKMKSINLTTRKASIDCAGGWIGNPTIPPQELKRELEAAYAQETNSDVKTKIGHAMKILRKRENKK